MSRIGKKPIPIPEGVTVRIEGQAVTVAGGKSTLSANLPPQLEIRQTDALLEVGLRAKSDAAARRYWGLGRSLIANLVEGVSKGFEKSLELQGVGYRAQLQGANLKLSLGYSKDILFAVPEGITIRCPTATEISVTGANKQQVGQVAAELRRLRPPEPYKGKGVRYRGEYIFRKEGKKK
ncbi:MAG: 50S ribosomal protein L6 [Hyphomicrobiales bacterium]|nr:50S ribosomal protein L6 [Hyphomicrobiales bacterium]